MNAEQLLAKVEALGVVVTVDARDLLLRPREKLSPSLVEEIRAHKPQLVELVSLRGWPEESRDYVRRFGRAEARLYPFLGKRVSTPVGFGRLEQVFPERAAVALESNPHRLTYALPSEIRPPDLAGQTDELLEAIH